MILNFIYIIVYLAVTYNIFFISNLYISVHPNELFILDTVTRLFDNDFYINRFYFFWTNFFYLYYFIVIVILSLYSYQWIHTRLNMVFIILSVGLFYFMSTTNYWFNAFNVHNMDSELLNPLLINSINKFHPFLFYIATFWSLIYYFKFTSLFLYFSKSQYYSYLSLCMLNILIFTLFLGSWWALQEGSWGGWWNWDPSEVFGLVVMSSYLFNLHSNTGVFFKKRYSLISLTVNILILTFYLIIQLNFDFVSHNFGTRTAVFVNLLTFLLVCFLGALFLLLIIWKFNNQITTTYVYNLNTYITHNYLLIVLIFFLLVYSFQNLLPYSIFGGFNFDTDSSLFSLEIIIICLLISMCITTYEFSLFTWLASFILFYLLSYNSVLTLILLATFALGRLGYIVHTLMIIFVFLSTQTYFKSILTTSTGLSYLNHYFTLNNLDIFTIKNLIQRELSVGMPSLNSLNSVEDSQWLFKIISENWVIQELQTGILNLSTSIHVFEYGHLPLVNTCLLFTTLFFSWKISSIKITY